MLGGKTACHKVNKLLSVQISLKCVDLRPILFSSPCVTSVTFDSQKFFTFIHSFRRRCCSPRGKYWYFCRKNNNNNKSLVHRKRIYWAQCHSAEHMCRNITGLRAGKKGPELMNFDYPKLVEKNSWRAIEKMFWKPGRGMCLWERPLSSGKIWMNIDSEGSYPCIVWKCPTKVLLNLDDIKKGLNIWISQDALLLVHGFACQILDCGWFFFFINTLRWK